MLDKGKIVKEMNLKALHKISYGLYIVCSRDGKKFNGQIANALFQVSSKPPTVALSINKQNLTHDYIKKSNVITISILTQDTPMKFIGLFGFKSGREIDKLNQVKYKLGTTEVPIVLDYALAYLEAEILELIDVGTHTIFVGKIVYVDIINEEEPMTYAYYHQIKGGYSPKTAPTYSGEVDKPIKEGLKMNKYVCTVCGYVYDPDKGDPDNGIEPGTKFEDLSDDWVCPICGATKDAFKKE